MQETHSTKENEIRWNNGLKSQIHYSHGKSKLRGVLIAFFGSITYTVWKKKPLINMKRMLITETLIDDTEFILINLYSANTEIDQLTTFPELTNLLENVDLT